MTERRPKLRKESPDGGVSSASSSTPEAPPAAGGVEISDHELLRSIGRGSYGEVWLARGVLGKFRAVKVVYRERFSDTRPYDREFFGILRV